MLAIYLLGLTPSSPRFMARGYLTEERIVMKSLVQLLIIAIFISGQVWSGPTGLAYRPELLVSRFASWGIDPDKHLASINLKDSWIQASKVIIPF
jgi:hypothetical protein